MPLGVFLKEDTVNPSNPRGGADVDFIVTVGAVASLSLLAPIVGFVPAIAVLVTTVIGLWIVSHLVLLTSRLFVSPWRTFRDALRRLHAVNGLSSRQCEVRQRVRHGATVAVLRGRS